MSGPFQLIEPLTGPLSEAPRRTLPGRAAPRAGTRSGYFFRIVLHGLGLTMAGDEILVADGLIRKVRIYEGSSVASDGPDTDGRTSVDVVLEHPAAATSAVVPGMPFRIQFEFPRDALAAVFRGKMIALDPGHGGKDAGVRGPVNLLEKDVALDIATELRALLTSAGAAVVISRENDSDVDARSWAIVLSAARPDALVEIHASGERDPMARTYRVYARRGSGPSAAIASEVALALTERMGIEFSGMDETDFAASPLWPAIRVEPVCLTHFVDEANFRAPLYRKRIAQAIFNGLSRYLSSASKGDMARAN